MAYSGTSFVTIAPEATIAPSPTRIPGRIIERLHIHEKFPITTALPFRKSEYHYNHDLKSK